MASFGSADLNTQQGNAHQASAAQNRFALISLTSLFFIWGFITAMNDILIPHLKGVFNLTYTQAMLVQFCFFGAYFLVSIPAGKIVAKFGYKAGIAMGLLGAAVGCVMFVPSAKLEMYWMFLLALFVLASGITLLQVAANPLVTLIGNPNTASSRLNLTQAFNSLGTTIAPIIGGFLIFGAMGEGGGHGEHGAGGSADTVILPYLTLAAILVLLALFFKFSQLPENQHSSDASSDGSSNNSPNENATAHSAGSQTSLKQYPHLLLGAVGIFVYVGAEVSVGSFLINFLGEPHIAGMSEAQAAQYVAYFWGGAMIGRFIGAAIMQKVAANKLLAVNSFASMLLIAIAMFTEGKLAMWSLLAVGLCNSIMFPTIFSLAINKLGGDTSRGSGLLCLAIVGGAIIPVFQGMLADMNDVQSSFILPLLCYVFIAFYGLKGYRPA